VALTKIGYTLIKDNFKDSVSGSSTAHSSSFSTRVTTLETSGSITESSASFSTRVATLETSGSITESSASFSTRVTTEEGNVDSLQTDSGSFSTRVTTAEASGALFDGTGAVTFATVDTGQGANELYDMDQNVKTDSNVTFGNVTATGTVTAEEFHTEFVSASIHYVSGSTKFGDTSDDVHSFTGSIHLVNSGSVSGSIFSTGSFGAIYAGGMSVPNLINVSSSVSTRATTLENANISGGFVAQTVLSGSGTLISGSSTSTGSFGSVHTAGNVGIGLTAPAGPTNTVLDVDGIINVRGLILSGYADGSSTNAYMGLGASFGQLAANEAGIINAHATGDVIFGTNSTERVTIDGATGKVGIGTTSPSSSLDVSVGGTDYITITNGGEMIGRIGDLHGSNKIGVLELFSDQVKNTRLVGDTGDNFFLGNVGIGTASPGMRLDIYGETGNINKAQAKIYSPAAAYNATGLEVTATGTDGDQTGINIAVTGSADTNVGMKIASSGGGTNNYGLIVSATSDNTGNGTGGALRVTKGDDTTKTVNIGYDSADYGFVEAVDENVAFKPLILNPTSGNVGIGTTVPVKTLTVEGAISGSGNLHVGASPLNQNGLSVRGNNQLGTFVSTDDDKVSIALGLPGDTQLFYLGTAASMLGSGTDHSIGLYADINANGSVGLDFYIGGTSTSVRRMGIEAAGSTNIYPNASGDGKLTIDSTATNDTAIDFRNEGTLTWRLRSKGNVGDQFEFRDAGGDDGVYIAQNGSAWADVSDERLKTSFVPIENAVDKLNTLQAINFKWKYGSEERQSKNNLGLIAQEVHKVFPEAVDDYDLEDFKLIDHPTIEGTKQVAQGSWGLSRTTLIPVLVKAIQELSAEVEILKAQVSGSF
jgi:trimeric autotransporter adhesin